MTSYFPVRRRRLRNLKYVWDTDIVSIIKAYHVKPDTDLFIEMTSHAKSFGPEFEVQWQNRLQKAEAETLSLIGEIPIFDVNAVLSTAKE